MIVEQKNFSRDQSEELADQPFKDMIADDLAKIKTEFEKGDCAGYLKFINEQYSPAER